MFSQTEIAYNRAVLALAPMLGDCPQLYKANASRHQLALINGAVMRFRSGERPDSLYGSDTHALVIDESSRLREEAWHAIRSTLTKTEGKARIIGNVRGRRNWAFHEARKAQRGDPDMFYTKMTAYDAVQYGVLSQKEIDDCERAVASPCVSRALYGGTLVMMAHARLVWSQSGHVLGS